MLCYYGGGFYPQLLVFLFNMSPINFSVCIYKCYSYYVPVVMGTGYDREVRDIMRSLEQETHANPVFIKTNALGN